MADLTKAEAATADLTARAAALGDNLMLLTGPAAKLMAERLNSLNADLTAAMATRDALATAAARAANPPTPRMDPADAVAQAALAAFQAMWQADPEPEPEGTPAASCWSTSMAAGPTMRSNCRTRGRRSARRCWCSGCR